MIKKFYEHIGKIKGIILILYITLILTISVFNKHYNEGWLVFLFFVIFLCLSTVLCPRILKMVEKIKIKKNTKNINYKKWFIITSLISLAIFLITFIIHYPGFFCEDVFDQYEQAITNSYNDWHPVMHTLVALKLPLLFTTNNWIGATTLFQIIALTLVTSYMTVTILKYTNKKIAIICYLFILLNPNVRIASFVVVKDVAFAIGAMLLLIYMMNIYVSKGKWFEKKQNIFVFILVFILTTLFRHNAILFTGPLMIAVLCLIDKKQRMKLALISVSLIIIIKVPVYYLMGVGETELRKSETLGMPLNIIATVYNNDKDNLNYETKAFIHKTSPENYKKIWGKYEIGDFNSVKGDEKFNEYVVDRYGYIKVGKMAINAFASSPKYALLGLTKATYPVYTINEDYVSLLNETLGADDNKYKIYGIRQPELSESEITDQQISKKIVNWFPFFKYIGLMNLLVLIGILVQKNYKKMLIGLPMLIYNFGTMTLLYSYFDTVRYFFYSFVITPIILVILFIDEEKK